MNVLSYIWILISLLSVVTFQAKSQDVLEIIYKNDVKKANFTKEFINNYKLYFIADSMQFELEFEYDTLLKIPSIPKNIQNLIQGKAQIWVKFSGKNKCYFSAFPNVFVKEYEFMYLNIFKTKVPKHLRDNRIFNRKHLELKYTIVYRENTSNLFPCRAYKGEFDYDKLPSRVELNE